jgi:hypothetical protein
MADDKTKKVADADRISLKEGYEIAYWTKKFGLSAQKLADAVKVAGPMVKDVEAHLKKKK